MAEHSDMNGSETGTELTEVDDDRNVDEENEEDEEVNEIVFYNVVTLSYRKEHSYHLFDFYSLGTNSFQLQTCFQNEEYQYSMI